MEQTPTPAPPLHQEFFVSGTRIHIYICIRSLCSHSLFFSFFPFFFWFVLFRRQFTQPSANHSLWMWYSPGGVTIRALSSALRHFFFFCSVKRLDLLIVVGIVCLPQRRHVNRTNFCLFFFRLAHTLFRVFASATYDVTEFIFKVPRIRVCFQSLRRPCLR